MKSGYEWRALPTKRHIKATKICHRINARFLRDNIGVAQLQGKRILAARLVEDSLAVIANSAHLLGFDIVLL